MDFRPTRTELVEQMNARRSERDLSIRAAARIAGVPATTAQGWLSGRHFPTPALRPKFLTLVAELGLSNLLHPDLWIDESHHSHRS